MVRPDSISIESDLILVRKEPGLPTWCQTATCHRFSPLLSTRFFLRYAARNATAQSTGAGLIVSTCMDSVLSHVRSRKTRHLHPPSTRTASATCLYPLGACHGPTHGRSWGRTCSRTHSMHGPRGFHVGGLLRPMHVRGRQETEPPLLLFLCSEWVRRDDKTPACFMHVGILSKRDLPSD